MLISFMNFISFRKENITKSSKSWRLLIKSDLITMVGRWQIVINGCEDGIGITTRANDSVAASRLFKNMN